MAASYYSIDRFIIIPAFIRKFIAEPDILNKLDFKKKKQYINYGGYYFIYEDSSHD